MVSGFHYRSVSLLKEFNPCEICVRVETGLCINNQTCICLPGYAGVACLDQTTTLVSALTANGSFSNISTIAAGVLGGALLAFVISLAMFAIWKRKSRKRSYELSLVAAPNEHASPTGPDVVPALYNIPLYSRRSSVLSNSTNSAHLYEEVP